MRRRDPSPRIEGPASHDLPAFILRGIWDEFGKRGISLRELERLSGIERPRRDDFSSTLHEQDLLRFFEAAATLSGEETLGLSVGRATGVASHHLVGHLILASVNLREALELIRGTRAHWRDPVFEDLGDGRVRFGFYASDEPTPGARLKSQMTGVMLHEIAQHFLGRGAEAPMVELGFPKPADTRAYQEAFPGGVRFGSNGTFVICSRSVLEQRHRSGADPVLAKHLLKLAQQYYGEAQGGDDAWTSRVRRALRSHRAPRLLDPGALARQLGVSPRGLWRRLLREGASFSMLLDEVLYERARMLLARPQTTCAQVAEALGYAELSSFYRAFRRWSGGRLPSEYRNTSRFAPIRSHRPPRVSR